MPELPELPELHERDAQPASLIEASIEATAASPLESAARDDFAGLGRVRDLEAGR